MMIHVLWKLGFKGESEESMNIADDIKEMSMYEMAGNCVYIKDKETWYRDFETELPLREFIREVMKEHKIFENEFEDDDTFDEVMLDWLSYGYKDIRGIIATWYSNLWAMAEYRETLQVIKSAVEEG